MMLGQESRGGDARAGEALPGPAFPAPVLPRHRARLREQRSFKDVPPTHSPRDHRALAMPSFKP